MLFRKEGMEYRRRAVDKTLDIQSIEKWKWFDSCNRMCATIVKYIESITPLCGIKLVKVERDYINTILNRLSKFVWKTTMSRKK